MIYKYLKKKVLFFVLEVATSVVSIRIAIKTECLIEKDPL